MKRRGMCTPHNWTYVLRNAPLISVVDDDASVRASMKRLMTSSGYNAESFPSVDGLLNSGQLNDISCIIADVQMPEANGFDMQRALKSAGYRIPIIFITAFPDDKGRDYALKAGAHCYLRKPVSIDKLLHCVESALSQQGEAK
jgi:FixJ family two-component response regulator